MTFLTPLNAAVVEPGEHVMFSYNGSERFGIVNYIKALEADTLVNVEGPTGVFRSFYASRINSGLNGHELGVLSSKVDYENAMDLVEYE